MSYVVLVVYIDRFRYNKMFLTYFKYKIVVEISGIEPEASHMRSERSTTELYPLAEGGRFGDYRLFCVSIIRLKLLV